MTQRRADIKLGFLCNNMCSFCVQGDKRNFFTNKSFHVASEELKKARVNCNDVVFTGGEATMHNSFLRLVCYARALGFQRIQIQTNGRLFAYKDFCKKIVDAGANEFCIAIHGPNKKIHDSLTNSPNSFDQSTQGIVNLVSLGVYVATNTVIAATNFRHLPAIASLLVNLNAHQFQFAFPHILGSAEKNKNWLIPKKIDVVPFVKKAIDIGKKARKRVMTEAIPYCLLNGYEQYVAEELIPDTKVFDANFVVNDYTAYRKMSGKIKNNRCHSCRYVKKCEGPWKEYPQLYGWDEFIPVTI